MKKKSNRVILNRLKKGHTCCPVCGCYDINVYNNGVGYPEIWVDWSCRNCGLLVGGADNSPYWHITDNLKGVRSMKEVKQILNKIQL